MSAFEYTNYVQLPWNKLYLVEERVIVANLRYG
jgi:hypothetical protein